MENIKSVWISWETQRRSFELARHLGCELYVYDIKGVYRYPLSILKTLRVLRKVKPVLLFVQNPSMILATLACCYCLLFSTRVIVDRHTTFMLTRKYRRTPSVIIFKLLHKFTIRFADLTIVTNEALAVIVRSMGGKAFVLPDKLPNIGVDTGKKKLGDQQRSILLISSFGKDEPIGEVLKAMELISAEKCQLYITGNYNKYERDLASIAPSNVSLTGFVPDSDFLKLLISVDVVMALTTSDYCMLCGCYEAVAAQKPLITSDKKELRDYFKDAVFVDNSPNGIAEGIKITLSQLDYYNAKMEVLKNKIGEEWDVMFEDLETTLLNMVQQ